MEKLVVPSIIASDQKEFDARFSKIKNISKAIHLDYMDGEFVKNSSLDFDFKPLPKKIKTELHLMAKRPLKVIKNNLAKADLFIFQIEAVKSKAEAEKLIAFVKSKGKKVGIAISPNASLKKIAGFLGKIDRVLVLIGIPGKYGAEFDEKNLSKIAKIKKFNPKIQIEVDIGINPQTIGKASLAGADYFVCGSFIQNSINAKKAIARLNSIIKNK